MKKTEALQLFGGTPSGLAKAVGVTCSAIGQWPEELKQHHIDRVQAALWRRSIFDRKPSARQKTGTTQEKK